VEAQAMNEYCPAIHLRVEELGTCKSDSGESTNGMGSENKNVLSKPNPI